MQAQRLLLSFALLSLFSCGQNVREEEAAARAVEKKQAQETVERSVEHFEAHQDDIVMRGEFPENAALGTYVLLGDGDVHRLTVNGWEYVFKVQRGCKTIIKAPGTPSLSIGTTGDCYLNTNNGNFRIKERHGVNDFEWVLLFRIWREKPKRKIVMPIVPRERREHIEAKPESETQTIVITGEQGPRGKAGRDGVDGKDGNNIMTFMGTPNNDEGNEGDLGLDIQTGKLYKKEAGDWIFLVHLQIHKDEVRPEPILEREVVIHERDEPIVVENNRGPLCKTIRRSHRSFFTRISKTELKLTSDIEKELPYKKLSEVHGRVKLDTLFHSDKNYELNGVPVVKDAQVVFGFKIPENIVDLFDEDVAHTKVMLSLEVEKYSFDESTIQTEQLCLSAKEKSACSGKLLKGDWLDIKRNEFYDNGRGIVNTTFTDDLFANKVSSSLMSQERMVYSLNKVYDLNSLLKLTIKDLIDLKREGVDRVYLVLTDDITVKNRPKMFFQTEPCQ